MYVQRWGRRDENGYSHAGRLFPKGFSSTLRERWAYSACDEKRATERLHACQRRPAAVAWTWYEITSEHKLFIGTASARKMICAKNQPLNIIHVICNTRMRTKHNITLPCERVHVYYLKKKQTALYKIIISEPREGRREHCNGRTSRLNYSHAWTHMISYTRLDRSTWVYVTRAIKDMFSVGRTDGWPRVTWWSVAAVPNPWAVERLVENIIMALLTSIFLVQIIIWDIT